jgi:hypothetical protein
VAGAGAGRGVCQRAGGVRSAGIALVDEIVAFPGDSGGLAAGLLEPAPRRAAAARPAARAGQQQPQPEQTHRPDHDAVENSVPVEPVT